MYLFVYVLLIYHVQVCEHAEAMVWVYRGSQELAFSFHSVVSVAWSQVVSFDGKYQLNHHYIHFL